MILLVLISGQAFTQNFENVVVGKKALDFKLKTIQGNKIQLNERYKNSPVINMILEVLMEQKQALEDAVYDVYTLCHLDTAFGVQLDRIGDIAGIQRYGLNDDDYRQLLALARTLVRQK